MPAVAKRRAERSESCLSLFVSLGAVRLTIASKMGFHILPAFRMAEGDTQVLAAAVQKTLGL
jgi:hypothetical protein